MLRKKNKSFQSYIQKKRVLAAFFFALYKAMLIFLYLLTVWRETAVEGQIVTGSIDPGVENQFFFNHLWER